MPHVIYGARLYCVYRLFTYNSVYVHINWSLGYYTLLFTTVHGKPIVFFQAFSFSCSSPRAPTAKRNLSFEDGPSTVNINVNINLGSKGMSFISYYLLLYFFIKLPLRFQFNLPLIVICYLFRRS